MDLNILGLGALAGLGAFVASFWSNLKSLVLRFRSVFVDSVVTYDQEMSIMILNYLGSFHGLPSLVPKKVFSRIQFVRSLNITRPVGYVSLPSKSVSAIFFIKRVPVFYSRQDEYMSSISCIRGTINLLDVVDSCLSQKKSTRSKRFQVFKESGSLGSSRDFLGQGQNTERESPEMSSDRSNLEGFPIKFSEDDLGIVSKSGMTYLALSSKLEEAFREAKRWKSSEQWFLDHDVPWKRGWLLEGEPGTGKTAFTRSLAQELDLPIVMFSLSTMSTQDFLNSWQRSVSRLPAIFLFEDIDAVFEGRVNKCSTDMYSGVSFDVFLNALDGIEGINGIFIIITTNHVESIDPAIGQIYDGMSSRPGRIDRVLHFDRLDASGREKIATRILSDVPREIWEHLLVDGQDDTGAQFQYRCSSLALKLWEERLSIKEVLA